MGDDNKMNTFRNKKWLINRYCINKLPVNQIARECGVTPMAINYWLNKYEIK